MNFLPTPRRKNRVYVITMVARKPRHIVSFDVAYDKSENRIQKLVDSTIKAKHYYFDANSSYHKVSYFVDHFFLRDKSHTFTEEGVNAEIRRYIAALQRKSECFFRSLETFKAIMHVFVYAYHRFGEFKQRLYSN